MKQREFQEKRRKYAEELVVEAKKGLLAGLPVYGDFHPESDPRNMLHEMQEEVVDAFNYNDMDIQMFPEHRRFHENMKTLLLVIYIALREEEERRSPESTSG